MDPMEQLRQSFLVEAEELILSAELSLSQIQSGETGIEGINSAFRAIHSIKGGAGAFGYQHLVALAHSLEAALDFVRSKKDIDFSRVPTSLFIRGVDAINDRIQCTKQGGEPSNVDGLIAELDDYVGSAGKSARALEPAAMTSQATSMALPAKSGCTLILKPGIELFRRVIEPRLLFQRLETFGNVQTEVILDQLPLIDELQPMNCYLHFRSTLESSAGKEAIHDICLQIFDEDEFVIEDGRESKIIAPGKAAIASEQKREGESVAASGSEIAPPKASGTLGLPPGRAATTTIRVDLDRIDRLMNLVGEIVITQSILTDRINSLSTLETVKLAEGVEALSRQMRELQDNVMAVRAQPVKTVFQRVPRMVRDLAEVLSKDVRVEMLGENTEIDKTIIEELTDPLIHMIRNSMDHGIESPTDRIAAGKDPTGTIKLNAEQKNGRIVITLSDDGRGINREKLLAKARLAGIVPSDASITPSEIDNLIFHPGLSTAEAVTDVSGRGVGMDVVRRNVEALGGRIFVESVPSKGCTFCLALPLTLAVLEGMIVRVGTQRVVIPITAIVETCRPRDHLCQRMPNGSEVIKFREQLAPMWDLGAVLGVEHAGEDRIIVVVENESGKIVCLTVDEIIGQQQVVVKSLEANYRRVPGASSATILGDGLVALILDVNLMHQGQGGLSASNGFRDAA